MQLLRRSDSNSRPKVRPVAGVPDHRVSKKHTLFIYLFIKTYLYRVVHNQTILILFYSVALFLAKSKSSDN